MRKLIPLCEKIGRERIEQQVHAFYIKLRAHPDLGKFFDGMDDFSEHEVRIADFWWQAMGGRLDNPPHVDMVGTHMRLGVSAADVDIWLSIFKETLYETMEQDIADSWYLMAEGIGMRLQQVVSGNSEFMVPKR